MQRSATLTPLLVQREARQAQPDSQSNILRVEKQEVPGETRGTGIPNHSPQSSHHHTPHPPPTLNLPPSSLHLLFTPPPEKKNKTQSEGESCLQLTAPPILSQRESPVVFPVAMFYLFIVRAPVQESSKNNMKTVQKKKQCAGSALTQ